MADKLRKDFNYIGKKFLVREKFQALCCSGIFQPGELVKVINCPSKNRLMIETPEHYGHRVKRSTLNRCCELIKEK